jgi:hypothetical protein
VGFDYDVAISFLSADHGTAVALRELLAPSLRVFEFSSRQEELAGKDGLVEFRKSFRSAARLVVVLFRPGWGETPWTRVEMILPGERRHYIREPKVFRDDRYEPVRAYGIGWGWRADGKVLTSAHLADQLSRRLLDRIAQGSGSGRAF